MPFSDKAKAILRRVFNPSFIYFLRSNPEPLSDHAGFDRGTPLDRYYIESFLGQNQGSIRGTCLELLNDSYTIKYGGDRVMKNDVLDIDKNNKQATIIDDLRSLKTVKDGVYDCIILTQVFQFIDDLDASISECYRILKPGGTLLATLPSLSRIDVSSGIDGDYWRFTTASTDYLFKKKFHADKLSIKSVGNARSGIFFYAGLAVEDASRKTLVVNDPNFPLIITVRAIK